MDRALFFAGGTAGGDGALLALAALEALDLPLLLAEELAAGAFAADFLLATREEVRGGGALAVALDWERVERPRLDGLGGAAADAAGTPASSRRRRKPSRYRGLVQGVPVSTSPSAPCSSPRFAEGPTTWSTKAFAVASSPPLLTNRDYRGQSASRGPRKDSRLTTWARAFFTKTSQSESSARWPGSVAVISKNRLQAAARALAAAAVDILARKRRAARAAESRSG